jgi:hypothetical protein
VNSLVLGKNSAVGSTLQKSPITEKSLFFDRDETAKLLSDALGIRTFLTQHRIDKVIYLLVDRNTKFDQIENSEVNFQFPIKIMEALFECKNVDFIWPSSIFCLDESMVESNPYLLSQNLAHSVIRITNKETSTKYSRIYLPQIYGGEVYRKHQPFLYKVRDLLQRDSDVYLINGKTTFRNFIHESDIPRILADSDRWAQRDEVSCLFEESLSWFEIADTIRKSYNSRSKIFDQIDDSVRFPEYKYSNLDLFNIGSLYSLSSFANVIERRMF